MPVQLRTGADVYSQRIINLASPTTSTDAVNKAYVDNVAAGLAIKPSVRAATTANITLSGTQTVDGVSLVANDRVLVKNQTTASANGIYLVASGTWTLAPDSANGELSSGALVIVDAGSTNAYTMWVLETSNPITVGTTSLTWAPFAVGVTYAAGSGITISSQTISVNADGTSIIADGTSVRINPSYTGFARKYASNLAAGSTSTAVTHGLNTTDVEVFVIDLSTLQQVQVDVVITSATVVTIGTATAVTSGQYRVVVIG